MGRDAKFVVRLSLEEEGLLRGLISTGKRTASVLSRARILLKADAGATGGGPSDAAVADAVESSVSTVHRTRQAFVEQGLEAALYRKKPTGRQYRKLDGAQEARLVARFAQPRTIAPKGHRHHQPRMRAADA